MAFIVLAAMLLAAQMVQGSDPNVLKKHAGFFDRNQDGIIHISESIEALGIGSVEATAFVTVTHTTLSAKTRPGQPFNIVVENIALAKHTSDSGVYATDGSFMSEIFEAIFTNHAHTRPNALNSSEVDELSNANRKQRDFIHWLGAGEWKLLYAVGKDADGFLHKENVRNVFDGSFFYHLAQNVSSGHQNTNA